MKQRIFVKKIEWLDEETKEADVTFIIANHEYNAFCHPCHLIENQSNEAEISYLCTDDETPIDVFLDKNLQQDKKIIQDKNDFWSYEAYGQIKQLKPMVLDCGDILLEVHDPRLRSLDIKDVFICIPIGRLDIHDV